MVKKLNHKIFNLIVMIIGILVMFGVLNISYADTDVVYSANQDYVAEEDEEAYKDTGTLWSNINTNNFFREVRTNVAKWYMLFRYVAIAVMLVLLVILAIRLALESMAPRKAMYKKMLYDWVVCFILLYMSHYYMIFIQYLNDSLLKFIRTIGTELFTNGKYDLYQTVKSRAYDIKFTVGFSGMIMYMTLVYLTAKYVYIYAKRFILLVILTILAPITMLFYSVQKILTGKSKVFTKWMEEYAVNVLIQAIHGLTYVVFVGTALKLTETSLFGILVSFIFLNFMSKAEKLFRRIFRFSSGSSMAEELSNSQLSELKDKLSTAFLATSLARKTELGKKIGDTVSNATSVAAVKLGGAIQNTQAFQDLVESREKKRDQKESQYNKKIEDAQREAGKLDTILNSSRFNLTKKERAKFEKALEKAGKNELKYTTKRQRLTIRRGIYERLRDALDYDNYTEYVEEDGGDFEAIRDADKNIIDIVPVKKGTGNMARKMIRTQKIYNAETDEYEKVGGVRNKLSEKTDEILGLTKEHKEYIKEAKTMMKDQMLGFGSLLLGMGTFVDNPSVGFTALAVGGAKWRNLTKQDESIKLGIKEKRAIKRIRRKMNKEYKHARFTTGSILSIDETIKELTRTDIDVASVNHLISLLRAGKLKYSVATMPFTLTGTKGLVYNALDLTRRMAKQHMDDIKEYERSVDVELMKAIVAQIKKANEEFLKQTTRYILDKDIARIMFETRRKSKTITASKDGKVFAFNSNQNTNLLSSLSRIREAIVDVAIRNNMHNLDELDLNNKKIRKQIVKELRNQGIITGVLDSDADLDEILHGATIEEEKENLTILGTKYFEAEQQDKHQAYIVDLEKSVTSGIYEKQKAYVEAKKGVSIEEFANAVIHKNVVGEFNGFAIDSSDYDSAEEIVKAYYKAMGLDVLTDNEFLVSQKEYIENLERNISKESKNINVNFEKTVSFNDVYSVVKIEPRLGTMIEDFAEEIVGTGIITKFNNFEIDTRYYETAEDIVEAYKKREPKSDTLVNDDVIVVEPKEDVTIEVLADAIAGKNIVTEFNGFVIDTRRFTSAEEIVKQYESYKKHNDSKADNKDINIRNIKYGETFYKNVGIDSFVTMLNSSNSDILNRKLYEKIVRQYIETHNITSVQQLYSPKIQQKIKQLYMKELNKDATNRAVISIAMKTKKDISEITGKDISSVATESEIQQFKKSMYVKMSEDERVDLVSEYNISQASLDDMLSEKVGELAEIFDKVILGALANHGIFDATAVNIKDANTAEESSLKADIINLLRANGIDNPVEELEDLMQRKIDSVTADEIENTVISKVVSDFVVEKCDGDASKLQEDKELTKELNDLIEKKFDELERTSTEEQQEMTENVVDILSGLKKNESDSTQKVTVGDYVVEKAKGEEADPNFDGDIPLPEVNAELVNDILVCRFLIPDGLEDVGIESCIKSLKGKDDRFISGIDILNLEDADHVACSRLTRGGKFGHTLTVRYPENALIIAGKVQENVSDSENDDRIKDLSDSVLENLQILNRTSKPEDVFGSDNIEALSDAEIQRLFKSKEIGKAQNITQDVIEKIRESKTSVTQPSDDIKLTGEIKDAILNNDFALGMREYYDNDSVEFAKFRKASTQLLNSLLQMKAVDEDADSLKMNKDSKNNKKFKKAKLELDENFEEIDIEKIIQSIYDERGGLI